MSFLVNKRGNFLKELCCGISGRYHKIHVVIFIIWFDKKYSFLCKWKAKLSLLKGTNTKRKKKDKLVLSPELRMQIGLCKESLELTFQALAFDIHSDKGIMLKISAIETLCGGQFASSTLLIKPTFFFEGGSFNFIL